MAVQSLGKIHHHMTILTVVILFFKFHYSSAFFRPYRYQQSESCHLETLLLLLITASHGVLCKYHPGSPGLKHICLFSTLSNLEGLAHLRKNPIVFRIHYVPQWIDWQPEILTTVDQLILIWDSYRLCRRAEEVTHHNVKFSQG